MRQTIFTCDKCGRQLRRDEPVVIITPEMYEQGGIDFDGRIEAPEPIRSFDNHDFCKECALDILKYAVTEKSEADPEEKEEDPDKKAVKVDTGKIKALHKAGWSVAKIADEIGCSEQTVYNHLKRIKG